MHYYVEQNLWKNTHKLGFKKYMQATYAIFKMALTPRERVLMALKHKEADRIPIHNSPWGATIDRWRSEGLPSGVSPADFFGYELAGFSADTSPQFPVEVVWRMKGTLLRETPMEVLGETIGIGQPRRR